MISRAANCHFVERQLSFCEGEVCGVAFPMECMCVATYLLTAESINACRCGVANKSRIIESG